MTDWPLWAHIVLVAVVLVATAAFVIVAKAVHPAGMWAAFPHFVLGAIMYHLVNVASERRRERIGEAA